MSTGGEEDPALATVLAAQGIVQRQAAARMERRATAADLRRPGTVLKARSGRRYVVQADGSWKRIR